MFWENLRFPFFLSRSSEQLRIVWQNQVSLLQIKCHHHACICKGQKIQIQSVYVLPFYFLKCQKEIFLADQVPYIVPPRMQFSGNLNLFHGPCTNCPGGY